MDEIWKDIEGYEGLYQVSNWGRVRSLHRKHSYCKSRDNILSNNLSPNYYHVALCKDGKVIRRQVHRLVAENFIPNPNNYPQVNHIDENKTNNMVDNLEWVTARQNLIHSNVLKKMKQAAIKKQQKSVIMYDTNGAYLKEFESATIAAKHIGDYQQNVSACCYGKVNRVKGYVFKFKE